MSILIVGVGPGLGQSIAKRFAREGMPVGLVARRQHTCDAVKETLLATGVPVSSHLADAGDAEQLRAALNDAVSQMGIPEVVVYNAGLIQQDAPGDLGPEEHIRAWRINVLGALVTATELMPLMVERGSGTYLLTGGMPAPVADYLSLSLGKAGLRALTAMLADHYRTDGLRIATLTVGGSISPGSAFDPDVIAEEYWSLHTADAPTATEVLFEGVC